MAYTKICGLKCTLFLDYDWYEGDKPLQKLTDDGKITWLDERMQMVLIRPLRKIYDKKSYARKYLHVDYGRGRSTPFIITASIMMNSIDALGSYLRRPNMRHKKHRKGDPGDKELNFLEFTKRYMPAWMVIVKAPHYPRMRLARIIWKSFRNALTHGLALEHCFIGGFKGTKEI